MNKELIREIDEREKQLGELEMNYNQNYWILTNQSNWKEFIRKNHSNQYLKILIIIK